jgi:hypothetical protein
MALVKGARSVENWVSGVDMLEKVEFPDTAAWSVEVMFADAIKSAAVTAPVGADTEGRAPTGKPVMVFEA